MVAIDLFIEGNTNLLMRWFANRSLVANNRFGFQEKANFNIPIGVFMATVHYMHTIRIAYRRKVIQ